MEFSSDPYELKLYQMFQSCDTKHCGYLDEESLRRLCGLLELHDKGSVLIENLAAEDKASHVTFENFKEALLNFLGTELDSNHQNEDSLQHNNKQMARTDLDNIIQKEKKNNEHSIIIADVTEPFVNSETEISDREISPKLVMGSKKYGRRSRPPIHRNIETLTASDTDDDSNDDKSIKAHRTCYSNIQVQRSSSQTDIPGVRKHLTAISTESKLKRCASLPAQKNLQNRAKVTSSASKMNKNTQTSMIEKQQHITSSAESLGLQNLSSAMHAVWNTFEWELNLNHLKYGNLAKDTPALMETLPVQSVLNLWERAQIPNGRNMLLALGFDHNEINLAQLGKVMEDEMRILDEEPQTTLMKASLVLQTVELNSIRQTARQLYDENAKLRTDNKDANKRIAIFTAEIDERHASLEEATKKEVSNVALMAARKDLTSRMAADRENWSNLNSRLEARIKLFEQNETKLKTELESVHKENEDFEAEHQIMQKQLTELLEKNINLNRELGDMEEKTHRCSRQPSSEKITNDEELLRLIEKVTNLQTENTILRDKNDELLVEVEALNLELNKLKLKCKKSSAVEELNSEENEMNCLNTATKRRGDSPTKTRLNEESPRLGKLRKCTNDVNSNSTCSENSDTSGEWTALNSELHNSQSKYSTEQEKVENLKKRVIELEELLKQAQELSIQQSNSSLTLPPEERCRELETSLEQMQRAYEDCEDYWQAKLSDERALFEKERQIYEEEQQESDKKFTELMEKVREYEEQFSKDGRLSPIEEKCQLEQQYADLEIEMEALKENNSKMLEEKSKEINTLQHEIEDLRLRLGESEEILTGASELNAEAINNKNNFTKTASPASSPISYLWHQSTIQEPSKNFYTLEQTMPAIISMSAINNDQPMRNTILTTSETTIFSTPPTVSNTSQSPVEKLNNDSKTQSVLSEAGDVADCETSSSSASVKSFETHNSHLANNEQQQHSITHEQINKRTNSSTKHNNSSSSPSPNSIKEELKRLKYFELSLREQIKDLSLQRDGLVMELQQLQEAKPVLEKAYARTAHPSLIQRVNQLELKNRHLQNVIKQQQQYTESLMQQSWRQHQIELNDLHGRLEAQGALIAEQVQRLQNADLLVKDLYVENSHLTANVQRLEQQRYRVNFMQQQQPTQRPSCSGLPGMP
uniref:EF-hand domain-containing protein n=1 Tax=Glossina brevipalpis TaxID=37001 RepID=A0A1A9WUV4_9MUSC